MKFGEVRTKAATGAILAHSVQANDIRLRKGIVLKKAEVDQLLKAEIHTVVVAQLGPDDVDENQAAMRIGAGVSDGNIRVSPAFTGRVNLYADTIGIVRVDANIVVALNKIDPAITLATLHDYQRVRPGMMVATIKIIAYGVARSKVEKASELVRNMIHIAPVKHRRVALIITKTPAIKPALLTKGEQTVRARLAPLGIEVVTVKTVPHTVADIGVAIGEMTADMVLILGASATSDINDVGPQAVKEIGGTIQRFGIPVDPGNLLFLGNYRETPVIGLPGCVRSKALNGADWVLERLACGLDISADDFAKMAVGGLLKEIPTRPQPRAARRGHKRLKTAILMLGAGRSARMLGRDKMLEDVAGMPMIRHAVLAAKASRADQVFVALPPGNPARREALEGVGATLLEARDHAEGMGGTIRNGMAGLADDFDAVIIALCDMPGIEATHFDMLITAFSPRDNIEICRAMGADGKTGQPVLFGSRFFESLSQIEGDKGGREILSEAQEYLLDVNIGEGAALIDLDTPQDWQSWRKRS